jgi:KTSC domain
MKRQTVDSSVIRSAGYDPAHNVLELEFVSGNIYQYHDVPEEEFQSLIKADSPGAFFNDEIKDAYRTLKTG